MQVFFIKSKYNGNTYKVSDFYTGSEYKTYMTKMLDLNFKPTDGAISIMTRQITLPDDTSIRDYTHMIVPDVEKIYEIINIDQQNSDQYRINLVEDAFIGNYYLFNNEEMILTRTNEFKNEWYQGANDITDMSYDYTPSIKNIKQQKFTGSKLWMAVWLQAADATLDVSNIVVETIKSNNSLSAEWFTNLTSITIKYPEFIDMTKSEWLEKVDELDYIGKIAYDKATNTYYSYDTRIYYTSDPNKNYQLVWRTLPAVTEDIILPQTAFNKGYMNNTPDIRTVILLFPFSERIYANMNTNSRRLLPAKNFKEIYFKLGNDTKVAANIISVKIIPESIITDVDLNTQADRLTIPDSSSPIGFTYTFSGTVENTVAYLKNVESSIDLSHNLNLNSIYNLEPFKSYELWVYGQKFEVPSYFANNIHMVTNLTTDGVTFNIYRDSQKTKLFASGTSTFDAKWSVDQLALYAQNNPTYKDEFNNQQQQKWAQTFASAGTGMVGGVASGAAAGSIIPGLGTAAGAIMGGVGGAVGAVSGIVSTGVQTHFDRKQFELMQRNKQMQPDQIYGNSASSSLIQKIRNGIYWVTKIGNNQSQMKNEYERKGYPTFITRKPTQMNWILNSLYDNQSTKIISGYFLKTLKNNYVTNEVNKKLTSGVTLIL